MKAHEQRKNSTPVLQHVRKPFLEREHLMFNPITLRPRQKKMTDKAKKALKEQGNTLCVAPTDAGKTIMLSMIVRDILKDQERSLILQHTDEIFDQNMVKFSLGVCRT